jgi:hypothetical protein
MPVAALVYVEMERTFRAALLRGGPEDSPAVFSLATMEGHPTRAARVARDLVFVRGERHRTRLFPVLRRARVSPMTTVMRVPKFGQRAVHATFS